MVRDPPLTRRRTRTVDSLSSTEGMQRCSQIAESSRASSSLTAFERCYHEPRRKGVNGVERGPCVGRETPAKTAKQ
jgi:hypothetical protein